MNELLMKRIERRLVNLADAQGYQVLDYVEFLETKYGTGERQPSVFERFADGVEDAMRVGRLPAAAIRGTMGAVDAASRLMSRLAEAGRSAADELTQAPRRDDPPSSAPADAPPEPPDERATPRSTLPEEPPASA